MTEIAAASLPRARRRLAPPGDAAVALGVFVALCVAVLTRKTTLLEPDDLAYRASIVALAHGHLTLSTAEYQALAQKLGGISQWVQLPNGRWISEKNPGYPFFAAPFQLLGILRLAPLFAGALACLGLFFGGRRWLGRRGGAWAVLLFCGSGAALVFAWRATMPTFTDASLVAAGTGALLWTLLADDAPTRRRAVVGTLAFVALEAATFMRYTDLVALAVAAVAVLAARPPKRLLGLWLGTVAAFVALVAVFDAFVYGGATKTGYSAGEITFSWSAVVPNAAHMPAHLLWSLPPLALALAAVPWIALRGGRRDAAVAAALAAVWLGIFALYYAYTWTVGQAAGGVGAGSVHIVRFYLPALGSVALLGGWLLSRLPRWTPLLVAAGVLALAGITYPQLAKGGVGRGGGFPGGGPPPTLPQPPQP